MASLVGVPSGSAARIGSRTELWGVSVGVGLPVSGVILPGPGTGTYSELSSVGVGAPGIGTYNSLPGVTRASLGNCPGSVAAGSSVIGSVGSGVPDWAIWYACWVKKSATTRVARKSGVVVGRTPAVGVGVGVGPRAIVWDWMAHSMTPKPNKKKPATKMLMVIISAVRLRMT